MARDSIRPKSADTVKPPPFPIKYTEGLTAKLRDNCHYRNHSRGRDTVSNGKCCLDLGDRQDFLKLFRHKLNFAASEGFLKIVLNLPRGGRSKTLILF